MDDSNSQPDATPDPTVVRGGNALGIPPPLPPERPLPPLDTRPDGIEATRIEPSASDRARVEFPSSTRVLYVNGVNSDQVKSVAEARLYANAINHSVELVHLTTRGMAVDILTAAHETFDQRAAFEGVAERAIAHEVLNLAAAGKDLHIMAYSRGALVTERGLERARTLLEHRGFSDSDIQTKVFSHVTVETVNGASHSVPDGVRAVHYVRDGDVLVGQALGMGPASAIARAEVAGIMALRGDMRGLGAEARDGVFNRPNGPVIPVPPLPTLDPIAQHLFEPMMRARQPFEKAYAAYGHELKVRMETHPQPVPGEPPSTHHMTPEPADVQIGLDKLRDRGVHLPDARDVQPWTGRLQHGPFVDLGGGFVAQHIGRGHYTYMNVERDLGGVHPPVGQYAILAQNGVAHVPQLEPFSLGR